MFGLLIEQETFDKRYLKTSPGAMGVRTVSDFFFWPINSVKRKLQSSHFRKLELICSAFLKEMN